MMEKFDRYEIIEEIGRGGTTIVYKAYDPRFERDVAIKVFQKEYLHDPQFLARFKRVIKPLALFEHAGNVPIYDFGQFQGQPFLVMRYLSGGSWIEQLKARKTIPVDEMVQFVSRIAPVLDAAHGRGIVHRDLKPGNILFDRYGMAYISDMGIARLFDDTLVLTGKIIGTPAYMSPEQARGDKPIDGRSDLYSLGVMIFEALAGRLPFYDTAPLKIAMKHILDPVPDILEFNPQLPVSCREFISIALAKDPGDRYQTAEELAHAFRSILDEEYNGLLAKNKPHKDASAVQSPTIPKGGTVSAPKPTGGAVSAPKPGSSRTRPTKASGPSSGIIGRLIDRLAGNSTPGPEKLSVLSIAHPKNLSKRYSTPFMLQLFTPVSRAIAQRNIQREFGSKKVAEQIRDDSPLFMGQTVKARLYHAEIVFSDPVIKRLDKKVNVIRFTGKPTDSCHPGEHHVLLSITDAASGAELVSASIPVQVTDFVFDHISRPFLSSAMSGVLGVGSFVMFVLTFLGQVDSTFGYTAGTTAGALASAVYWNFFSAYKRSSGKSLGKLDV